LLPLQTSVLRQAQARRAARSGGSQTATTGSDTWSSSEAGSDSDDSDSEASSGGRGTRPVRRQQQRTGRGQQVPTASGSSSEAATASAAVVAGSAMPAASPGNLPEQGPILHQPYSHLLRSRNILQVKSTVRIASPLCTDIEELQSVSGSCSVQVFFAKHSADWDVKGYILQHPVICSTTQQCRPQPLQRATQASLSSWGHLRLPSCAEPQGEPR
jgi:hypothetical protein